MQLDTYRGFAFMKNTQHSAPRQYHGVMVSSIFIGLERHRAALVKAIKAQGLSDVAMENYSARADADVIDSSLQMVQDAAAYIGVIGCRYGQAPFCPKRNPRKLSLTELEFNEARRLERPILLFIMGENHPVRASDIELSSAKRRKLEAFREKSKRMKKGSAVHRVYDEFDSLEEFTSKAIHAVANLRRYLDERSTVSGQPQAAPPGLATAEPDPIPTAPKFYAEPPYIGSHDFVGRQAQLDVLSDWAARADPHPILLFEAIGGAGKSMLTWEWTTKHATLARGDWAGRFWYSFYERGALMADFCQRALAYITGNSLNMFRGLKTPELSERLLRHLQDRPWLLILDGLERVLVAYHRFDAAQARDEDATQPIDKIARRNPCTAIRPEDDDLIRALAAALPSKLLVTSRLVPRVLLNSASQPIPGVLRVSLPGLRSPDAEALFRSCGVTGTSRAIQDYLKAHCDCHPLVTGVLAGLINDYLPDKGNFDRWVTDPAGGVQLKLDKLDLVKKRNHILTVAIDALPEMSRRLLSTLALLSEAADYPVLSALNPHLPAKGEEVKEPTNPHTLPRWSRMSDTEKALAQQEYEDAVERWQEYDQALKARLESEEFLRAPQALTDTVRDLEGRGLLQYDALARRYDLHPVVRGIAAGRLRQDEKEQYGLQVVDYFSQRAHNPYEQAETLEDLRDGLHIIRTLLQLGRYQQACDAYSSALANALGLNLGNNAEKLSLLRPFFPKGWNTGPDGVAEDDYSFLANSAANALWGTGEPKQAISLYGIALSGRLRRKSWEHVRETISNIAGALSTIGRLASAERCVLFSLNIASLGDDPESLFVARLGRFDQLATFGRWADAEDMWETLNAMGRDWRGAHYTRGSAELSYAMFRFLRGDLTDQHLEHAEQILKTTKYLPRIRFLHFLRGAWLLEQREWKLAADSLDKAVQMAREIGQHAEVSEAMLALAKFHLQQLPDPAREAEELANAKDVSHRHIANLWLVIGDTERAKVHARAAYHDAWADGEPYVDRRELDKAGELLKTLSMDVPHLPAYDPDKDEQLPWEAEVAAAIEELRAKSGATNLSDN